MNTLCTPSRFHDKDKEATIKKVGAHPQVGLFITHKSQAQDSPYAGRDSNQAGDAICSILNNVAQREWAGPTAFPWVYVCDFKASMKGVGERKRAMLFCNTTVELGMEIDWIRDYMNKS